MLRSGAFKNLVCLWELPVILQILNAFSKSLRNIKFVSQANCKNESRLRFAYIPRVFDLAEAIVERVFVAGMHRGVPGAAAAFWAGNNVAQNEDKLHDDDQTKDHKQFQTKFWY